MIVIEIPVQEIADELAVAADELEKAERTILEKVAETLIEMLHEDFAKKSSGGTGAGGISWDRDKKNPAKKIGVVTGETEQRIVQSPAGEHAVNVLFASAWSRHLDRMRTLIPDPLPVDWLERLDEIALPIAEKIVREVLSGVGT